MVSLGSLLYPTLTWGGVHNHCDFGLCWQQPPRSPQAVKENLLAVAAQQCDGRVGPRSPHDPAPCPLPAPACRCPLALKHPAWPPRQPGSALSVAGPDFCFFLVYLSLPYDSLFSLFPLFLNLCLQLPPKSVPESPAQGPGGACGGMGTEAAYLEGSWWLTGSNMPVPGVLWLASSRALDLVPLTTRVFTPQSTQAHL